MPDILFKDWVHKVEGDNSVARCYCSKTIDIGNMGKSHMKGQKHQGTVPTSSKTVQWYFDKPNENDEGNESISQSISTNNIMSLDSLITNTSVVHAEISKYSKSSCDDIGQLFAVMFQHSNLQGRFITPQKR